MKTKFSFLATLVVALGLMSCSENNDLPVDTDNQSIYLKIGNIESAQTRSEGTAVTEAEAVTLTDGYIYFITAQDGIKEWYKIASSGTSDVANKVITTTDLKNGFKFSNVSGEVSKVYIVGNPNLGSGEATTMEGFKTLSELKAGVNISISSQNNVQDLTIVGEGGVTAVNTTQHPTAAVTDRQAVVSLTPLCARIEVGAVKVIGTITGYTLKGIYVNRFYANKTLSNVFANLQNEESTDNFGVAGTGVYSTYQTMCDQDTISIGNKISLTTSPKTGNVWAYQFFPGGAENPRITLKLSGITSSVAGESYPDPQFVNIRGFLNSTSTAITTFAPGTIYHINEVSIEKNNLTQYPDPEDINLWVTVTINTWKVEVVTPIM